MDFGYHCYAIIRTDGTRVPLWAGIGGDKPTRAVVTDVDGGKRLYRDIPDDQLDAFKAWVGDVFEADCPIVVNAPHDPRELTVEYK